MKVGKHADKLAISGIFPPVMSEIMERVFGERVTGTVRWKLSINAIKTELMLFAIEAWVPDLPLQRINEQTLFLSLNEKYLDVILVYKLHYRLDIALRG